MSGEITVYQFTPALNALIVRARQLTDERGNVRDGVEPSFTAAELADLCAIVERLDGEPVPQKYRDRPYYVSAMALGALRRDAHRMVWQTKLADQQEQWKRQGDAWEADRKAKAHARAAKAKADEAQGLADGEAHAKARAEANASIAAMRRTLRTSHRRPS